MGTTKQARKHTKPAITKCANCGKVLTQAQSVSNAMGHKCAQQSAKYTKAQLLAHKKRFTLPNVPNGFTKTAITHHRVKAMQAKGANITITKFVNAFGGDKGLLPLLHPIFRFYYVTGNKARYQHPFAASPQGLQVIASGNTSTCPKAPTKAILVKAIKANQTFSA